MKPTRILAIIKKDIRESIHNRVILIAIFLPLFASLLFSFMDNIDNMKDFQLAVVEDKDRQLAEFIESNIANFNISSFSDRDKGLKSVKRGVNQGLVIIRDGNPPFFEVYIDNKSPVTYLFLKNNLAEILRLYLGEKPVIDWQVKPVNSQTAGQSLLPTWIMITITMIGVMVISGNFAEEKDTGTLASIRVSPAGDLEILTGKAIFGILLTLVTVILILLFNRAFPGQGRLILILFLTLLSALNFTAIGLLIGIVAGSQSTARSLGTIVYFPLLFPVLIYRFSSFTRFLAGLFPSFYLYRGLEKVFYYKAGFRELNGEISYLLLYTLILAFITYFVFKRMITGE